jgi:nucleotide-binding universal stress UspA family protein
MNSSTKRYVILAAIDESPRAEAVMQHTATLARTTPGAEIHLVHAVSRNAEADKSNAPFAAELGRRRAHLDERAREAVSLAGVPVVAHLFERDPAQAILQAAVSLDADLVVVGTADRKGLDWVLLGSVAQRVMRDAACPVLLVRPKEHAALRAPEIEPPCPACLREQATSHGTKLWCARHSAHHPHVHLHYEIPQGFGAGSSLVRSSS